MANVKWQVDPPEEPEPIKGKLYLQHDGHMIALPDSASIMGFDGTLLFEIEDESYEFYMDSHDEIVPSSIKIKNPDPNLYKLIHGSTASASLNSYAEQISAYTKSIAAQSAVPTYFVTTEGALLGLNAAGTAKLASPPLVPASLDDIPGDFPTVHLNGTPPAAKQKLIDQIDPCDELPLLSKEVAMKISKALNDQPFAIAKQSVPEPLSYKAMQEAINKMYCGVKAIHTAAQGFAAAIGESSSANHDRAEQLHRLIPGVDEVVKGPCGCHMYPQRLWGLIQHLNDHHNPKGGHPDPWSRERIADWLETLDVDLRVQEPPTFEVGDVVHTRELKTRGTVKEIWSGGEEIVVRWDSGDVSHISAIQLVAGEPPETFAWDPDDTGQIILKLPPQGFPEVGLAVGNKVQDLTFGNVGEIVGMKKSYDFNTNSNQIELKVCYANGEIVFTKPSQVKKVSALKPWQPMQHLAHGFYMDSFVEVVGAGFGHVKGFSPTIGPSGQAVFGVKLQDGKEIMTIPEAMKHAVEPSSHSDLKQAKMSPEVQAEHDMMKKMATPTPEEQKKLIEWAKKQYGISTVKHYTNISEA